MSRRHLLSSVGIQGLGAAATFAVGLAIAVWQGPQAQGHYGLVRTAADLVVALALFGLPQSMVHGLNQRGASAASLERVSWRYAAALLACAVAACAVFAACVAVPTRGVDAHALGGSCSPWSLGALLLGSIGWTLQGLLRALALARGSAVQFAWQSVTPSLTLLAAVAALLVAGSQRFELALAASGVASVLLATWQLRPLRAQRGWRQGAAPTLASLAVEGTHAFAQSATIALQPWLTLLLLRHQVASVAEVGQFVFAAYVFQAFALPTSFVAPLLFARVSAATGAGLPYATRAIIGRVLGWTAAASLGCALLLPRAVPALFGIGFAPAVGACVLLALAGPLLVANRLGVSVLFGRGRFRAASAHAVLRAAAVPLCLWMMWSLTGIDRVTGAGVAWLLTESVCLLALVALWRRSSDQPVNERVA